MQVLPQSLSMRGRCLLAALVCALCLPSLCVGLVLDDHLLAYRLTQAGTARWQGVWDAFSFGSPHEREALLDLGVLPWWSDPALRLRFLRPLAALWHLFDFTVVRAPWLMHVESLALLFALNLSVGAWYVRLFAHAPRVSALAFIFFALAPGHGFVASWIANRNSCLATLFAVFSLLAHDRARSRQEPAFQLLSLLMLLVSLGSSELGSGALGLLVAYAIFLDRGSLSARWVALLPTLLLAGSWLALYRAWGYGAHASSLYLDPVGEPWRVLQGLTLRLPILLFGQWVLPIVSGTALLSRAATTIFAGASACILCAFIPALRRALGSDPRARFCGLAAIAGLLPVISTVPHDRLTLLSDVGSCGLFAHLADYAIEHGVRSWLVGLVRVRVVMSALLIPVYAVSLLQQRALTGDLLEHSLREPELAHQSLIFVNAPSAYFPAFIIPIRARSGGPVPRRVRALVPGIYPLTIARIDAHTLRISAQGGLLQPLGSWRGDPGEPTPAISPIYLAQRLNQFCLAQPSFSVGARLRLSELEVEIARTTVDGFPSEVLFRFRQPLEHTSLRFLRWEADGYAPFTLPEVGRATWLPAIRE